MLVLQSCTDPLEILPGPSSETFPALSDVACNFRNTELENVDVKGDDFVAVSEVEDIGIKQEDIPKDKHFPDIKSEVDEVSYVFVCLLLDTFSHYLEMSVFFKLCQYFWPIETAPLLGITMFFFVQFIFGSGVRVCIRWVCLQVIAENTNICSYLHVAKKFVFKHSVLKTR
jgi:hypothetical protein